MPLREAKGFYGVFGGLIVLAAAVALAPGAPLGLITLAVQAMCGLMLPSTSIIVLLLANDHDALGPWVNARWLNAVAVVIVASLVVLSVVMMISTLFSSVNVVAVLVGFGAVAALGLAVGLPIGLRRAGPRPGYAGRPVRVADPPTHPARGALHVARPAHPPAGQRRVPARRRRPARRAHRPARRLLVSLR